MSQQPILRVSNLVLKTPSDRVLMEALNLQVGQGDRVALIGRNGVGKSTLLEVLSGAQSPSAGRLECHGIALLVRQNLKSARGDQSRGEARRHALRAAFKAKPEVLLLDEPTQDLDAEGVDWLIGTLRTWQGALLCVSHSELLLAEFHHFFIVAESGCRYLAGTYSEVAATLAQEDFHEQRRYLRTLNALTREEERNALVRRRRQRKKNGGRVRELDRAPSRAKLNAKRSYAQESQGKQAKLQSARIETRRALARATRRTLEVNLALGASTPLRHKSASIENIELESVRIVRRSRVLVESLTLRVCRERVALTGANGSGKTSLLAVMLGTLSPTAGFARRSSRIGSIAQGATDWMLQDSLLETLHQSTDTHMEKTISILVGHRFPVALAKRPFRTLSPGERLRAALICLFEKSPQIEVLVLDEPTYSLDRIGQDALQSVLRSWKGGLVVVSHDRSFLDALRIDREIVLPTASEASGR